jgi:hypothetical protein
MGRVVVLDREQRDVLRRLVDVDSQGMADDVALAITHRDRRAAVEAVGRLQAMVALLDAIDWAEPEHDGPARAVELGDAVVGWALRELATVRQWLPQAVAEGEPDTDEDLLALAVLREVAGVDRAPAPRPGAPAPRPGAPG